MWRSGSARPSRRSESASRRSPTQLASLAAPVGPLVAGALLGAFGAPRSILVYAAWLVALAIVATLYRGVRESTVVAPT
jgi:hypothetical protein